MALGDIWKPRVDGVDDADSSAVNEIAEAVIALEENGTGSQAPVRGIDYWTDEDIAEIKSYVDDAILGGAW